MTLDLTKPTQTQCGWPVRILCTNRKGFEYPVVGLITNDNGNDEIGSWTSCGRYYCNGDYYKSYDLVNVPQRIRGYVHFYRATNRDGWYVGCFEPSLKDFLPSATNKAVARLRIDIQEGQYDT